VLQDFITTNRMVLIDRCRAMGARRSEPNTTKSELAHGIPIFLDQLINTLTIEQTPPDPLVSRLRSGDSSGAAASELAATATLHGRDLFERGFTLEQVVRDYGDVCQAVTNLAYETGAPIEVDEFRTFNRCLDNAIAAAVTAYAHRQAAAAAEDDFQAVNSRLGPFAHELRNYLHTATLAVRAIKAGSVGISGATGAVLDRSLLGMRNLIDRSLAEVRVTAAAPARLRPIGLANFMSDVVASASLDSQVRGCHFKVTPVDQDLMVNADPEMLSSAVGNLLQNAFKFTKPHTEVRLHVHAVADRILIEVEDHCGGLPTETTEKLLLPFAQSGEDRSGLGLGLEICRRSVEVNNGVLSVRDVPGSGCIFTVDLPRITREDLV
jgi:signal transduction histidine kinase